VSQFRNGVPQSGTSFWGDHIVIRRPARLTAALTLTLAGLAVTSVAPAGAATSASAMSFSCAFGSFAVPWSTTATLTAPDSVAPGGTATIGIAFADAAGPTNGAPAGIPVPAGTVTGSVSVAGGSAATVTASGGTTPAGPANGAVMPITGLSASVTAGSTGGTDLVATLDSVVVGLGAFGAMTCTPAAGSARASIAVPIDDATPPTTPTPTTAPPTTAPPATTPPTAPTTAPPATPAPAPDSPAATQAVIISGSESISYTCVTTIGGNELGNETANQTVTISAPDKVNPGSSFSVSVKVSPGPANGPVPIEAGTMSSSIKVGVSGGTPGTLSLSGGSNSAVIQPQAKVPVPTVTGRVTATGAAGTSISYTAGVVSFSAPSLGNASVTCTPATDTVVLRTAIVDEPLILPGQGPGGAGGASGGLPATGSTSTPLALVAGLLIALGAAAMTVSRRVFAARSAD
jgi:LPXTG-motif cell wall-anchored protein